MAVFRFLVNVDKCIDMSHYKCFFYKLKGQGDGKQSLFQLSEAQLSEGDPMSLHRSVREIRMHLDKYPYEVEDYRIIIVMRCPWADATSRWEQTVLYRLLRLRYEFQQSHILLSTAAEAERDNALNLVMLYDSDFSAGMPELEPYLSSQRFSEDVKLFMAQYGALEGSRDIKTIRAGLEASITKPEAAGAERYRAPYEAEVLLRYLAAYEKTMPALEEAAGDDQILLAAFVKEMLCNYRVYERFVNRLDRREETLTLLRITDFINHDTAPVERTEHTVVSTLAQRCDMAWKEVWSDAGAKERYATMLSCYRRRLDRAQRELENPLLPVDANTELPPMEPPGETAISSESSVLEEGGREKQRREDVLQKLAQFAKKKLYRKNFRESWNNTYEEILKLLGDLRGGLKLYAQDLSDQYAGVLAERKRQAFAWKNTSYVAQPKDTEQLDRVEEARSMHLEELKKPQMNPTISFQDALNSEQELDRANKNICFYLDCLQATNFISYLLLLLCCGGFFLLHYTVLQPYALAGVSTLLYYLGYIGAAVVLMGLGYGLPYRYYRSRVRKCVERLSDTLGEHIKGYYEKAKYFSEYINHMNCLDYLTRYRDMLTGALSRGRDLKMGQMWHREQLEKHKEMLGYFSGLIESAPAVKEDVELTGTTVVSGNRVCDVTECSVYWPQG